MPSLPRLSGSNGADAPRVLVCDDTAQIRVLVRLNLELEGYAVEEASDGIEAIARLRADGPRVDVVTVDALMPRQDGWATVTMIRGDPALSDLIVVMVTASTQRTDYARALRVGVDDFVAKPFEPEQLIALVGRLLLERQQRASDAASGAASGADRPGG